MSSYYEKMLATGEVKCIDEEIPFEVPKGWEWERLGNITTIKGGKRIPVGMKLTIENTGHKYIRVADMKNHSVKSDDIHYISDDIYEIIKAYYISKDDLYITVAGTIGNVGVVPEEFDNANLTENADKIEIYSLCKRYLLYALLSEVVQEQVRECTTKVGQPKLAIVRIQKFLIPIAPLADQRRISNRIDVLLPIVDKYDFLFSKLGKLNNSINEVLKKSILQEAIQGKLVPQITEEGTAQELLEQINAEKQKLVKEGKLKKSALNDTIIFRGDDNKYYEQIGKKCLDITDEIPFDIPENWQWIKLDQGISLLSGRDLEPSQYNDLHHGIPYITGASNFVNSNLIINRWTEAPITISNKGDLLLTCKGTIGSMAFNDIGQIHIARQVMAITSYGIDLKYIKCFLQSSLSILEKNANSMIPGISRSTLLGMLFPLPPFKEQQRIVAQIEKLFEQLR